MFLGLPISGVCEVVGAFLGGEGVEQLADRSDDSFDGARCGVARQVLELGEDLFDRVQIGRILGQEEQLGACRSDGAANGLAFMAAEIVHDHQIAWPEGGDQHFLDIGFEAFGVDRAIEQPWRLNAIMTKRGEEGQSFPVAIRNLGHEPLPAPRPSPERRHVGFRPGLVDEDQALRIDLALPVRPLDAPARDVGSVAFAGDEGFFGS